MNTDLDQILELYNSRYIHTILQEYVNPDDIDDLVQEIALNAFLALQRYEQQGITLRNPRAWLRRITLNARTNYCRQHASQAECLSTEVAEEDGWQIESDQTSPTQVLIQQELEWTLIRLMNSTRTDDARLLAYRFLHGITYREMAHMMNLKPATIRSKIARVIHSMRENLIKKGHFDKEDLQK